MPQLQDIESAQRTLEDCFSKRMDELESQLQTGAPTKDTVSKVAEEFRQFREIMFKMLSLIRDQINECYKSVDAIETRHRRKALIFLGVPEEDKEQCSSLIIDIASKHLSQKDMMQSNITMCHRIGAPNKERPRPILVRFCNAVVRNAVWRAKKGLKGSSVSIREFLTKVRQTVFTQARHHFGLKGSWTQDGIVVVKAPDGCRHKIVSMEELKPLLLKYPKTGDTSSVASKNNPRK